MIKRPDMQRLANNYPEPSIATFGSHSALDISRGAKDESLRSLVIAKMGRERTYDYYNKTKSDLGCIDQTIVVSDWGKVTSKKVLLDLVRSNAIFIPHRAFQVYLGYNAINNNFAIPIFGNRKLLQAEERTGISNLHINQDKLLELAQIPTPKKFGSPDEIDRRVIIKSSSAVGERGFERSFPIVNSKEEYKLAFLKEISRGKNAAERSMISKTFKNAPIQEYLEGKQININYFYSPLSRRLELMGTDMRLQFPFGEELAHFSVSLKESLLEQAYSMGEKLLKACQKFYKPGIIGPFALQTIAKDNNKLLVYDVSFRIPGSPDSELSPYTLYLHGTRVSFGRRIAMEIKEGYEKDRIKELVT